MDKETWVLLGFFLLAALVVAPPRLSMQVGPDWSFAEFGSDQGPAIMQTHIAAGLATPSGYPERAQYLALAGRLS